MIRSKAGPRKVCDPSKLIERVRTGDPALLEDLFSCYRADLMSFMQRRCGNPADAEDAVQDTFAAAARYLDGFRGETAIRNWLYKLASSACLRMRRGAKGDRSRHAPLDAVGELVGGGAIGALSPEVAKEAVEQMLESRLQPLERVLSELSQENRAVLMLRDGQGLTTREVAEALELSEAAVKTRLHRTRLAVREELERGSSR